MRIDQINRIRQSHPDNLMAKYFDPAYYHSLSPKLQTRLQRIIQTGIENPDSIMGAYVMQPDDYERFQPYLDQLIRDYHGVEGNLHQLSDWDCKQQLDLRDIDRSLAESSMRVRVGRNLDDCPLPGAMNRDDRIALEARMVSVFAALIDDPSYAGRYISLTPGSAHQISSWQYQRLVDEHKMFRDISTDPYLSVAGISSDWPYGRGMYESADGQLIVWVGEEDHLRIMSMKRGAILNDIFDRLRDGLAFLEQQGLNFARSERYGYITSCPTNLGTGMRASLHLALPKLTQNGQNLNSVERAARALNLSVRGVGGEHTAAGAGGVVDISPTARMQVTEESIGRKLYLGVESLWRQEQDSSAVN